MPPLTFKHISSTSLNGIREQPPGWPNTFWSLSRLFANSQRLLRSMMNLEYMSGGYRAVG